MFANKTTVRYHLTSARWLSSKNPQTTNAGESVERREPFFTVSGNVIGIATMENRREVP